MSYHEAIVSWLRVIPVLNDAEVTLVFTVLGSLIPACAFGGSNSTCALFLAMAFLFSWILPLSVAGMQSYALAGWSWELV